MNPKIDRYLNHVKNWQAEMNELRAIILDCGLTEELKWRLPCYSHEDHNIVIIQGFKEFCALMFFKGALLKDPKGILVRPGENSQAARRVEFTSVEEIKKMKTSLKAYIKEAIKAEKAGLTVELKTTKDYKIPAELQSKFKETPALQTAFKALTPGRQRAYLLYFSAAKQSKTREARIEKCRKQILNGKGLND